MGNVKTNSASEKKWKRKKTDASPIIGCPMMGIGHLMMGEESLVT